MAILVLVSCNTQPEPVLILPTQTSGPVLILPTPTAKSVKLMFPIIYQASAPTALITEWAAVVITELPPTEMPVATQIPTSQVKENPEEENCAKGCVNHKEGCDIKGNISFTSGEKIYHVPGGAFYDDTVINSENGERWFCTEAEAIANGWRKSKR